MKLKIIVIFFLALASCARAPVIEPNGQMRSAMLLPPTLRQEARYSKLFVEPQRDDDRVDWKKFKPQKDRPLEGMRIALDPGHVGTPPWDERSGKYVTNSLGQRLSEGVMALQLARLLEQDLKHLGAIVYVDRERATPVTARDYRDFSEVSGVFFQRIDLDARAERLWNFHPDITLILHFDAHLDGDMNLDHATKLCNSTKAYVPGAFSDQELSDQDEQIFFKIIWRNPQVWNDSLALSEAVVNHIHKDLGIPLEMDASESTEFIQPGVFSRNLHLQRRMAGFVSTYLESLCYENPAEFKALSQKDHVMKIADEVTYYSERLVQLAKAIRNGVVDFTQARDAY